jgi:flagellar basal body-associated protein FliL
MDKRQRHNILLVLAVVVLLIGVIVQVYMMVSSGQKAEEQTPMPSTTQPN